MKTKIGFIGLGDRGINGLMKTLLAMDDVEIRVVCDLLPDCLEAGRKACREKYGRDVDGTADHSELMARDDIEAVIICSSWNAHIPLAIEAMRAGKYAGFEVGPAQHLGQCYELVRTYEETQVPCMLMENCDYGQKELTLLNMIRQGIFGEITHCEAGYEHDLRGLAAGLAKNRERSFHNLLRNGDLYLTHGVGPIINYLGINRGNRMLTLTSMASKSIGLNKRYEELYGKNINFRMGDVITTMISCSNGETILLRHNVSAPCPYSRAGRVHGTAGVWVEDNKSIHIEGRSPKHKWEPFENYMKEYEHPLWSKKDEYEQFGHGGTDYLMLRAFLYSVRNKIQTPIDVYDSATMMALSALSEMSIAQGSAPLSIPDFTLGKWVCREPAPKSIFSLDQVHMDLFDKDLIL